MEEGGLAGKLGFGSGLFAREIVLDLWGDIWEPHILVYAFPSVDEIVSDFGGQYHLADEYVAHGQDSLLRGMLD